MGFFGGSLVLKLNFSIKDPPKNPNTRFFTKLKMRVFTCQQCEYSSKVWFTLYNVILRIARNFLETRENIKTSTHPFYHINLGWFSWEWSKKNFFFFEKKNQNGRLKKSEIFKIANSQIFFEKISQIGPWVSRIEWCKWHWCGLTYMAVRLSNINSKTT